MRGSGCMGCRGRAGRSTGVPPLFHGILVNPSIDDAS
jgi:hypothetical protein